MEGASAWLYQTAHLEETSVDSETQEIQAVVLSDGRCGSGARDQSTESVEQMSGDGAYDKRKVYEGCAARGISG